MHQCMHGQASEAGIPLAKPTACMSNSLLLLTALDKRCSERRELCSRPRGGTHDDCLGKVAYEAAIFSNTLCQIMLSGFSAQLRADKRMRENEVGVNHVTLDGSDELDVFAQGPKLKSLKEVHAAPEDGAFLLRVIGGLGVIAAVGTSLAGENASRAISSPVFCVLLAGENDADLLAVGDRHERYIDHITGPPLDPDL